MSVSDKVLFFCYEFFKLFVFSPTGFFEFLEFFSVHPFGLSAPLAVDRFLPGNFNRVCLEVIKKILDAAKVLHLGLCVDNEPYVVPMNYGYTLKDGKLTLWLHGAKRGRKLDLIRANPKVFFEMECGIQPFEGEIACKYGITYSSIMGRGKAEIVEDIETKKSALSFLMKTQTGKDFEFEDKMAAVVSVIRIDVSDFTAKHRPSPVK